GRRNSASATDALRELRHHFGESYCAANFWRPFFYLSFCGVRARRLQRRASTGSERVSTLNVQHLIKTRIRRRNRLAAQSGYRKGRSGLTISRRDSDRMNATHSGIDGYVGNTPLIRLRRVSELTGCEILGKAEFMNPAGSVKDRAAYGIITDAEAAGRLKPGATIVEGTAGNTGIGLAVIGRARGYRTLIVIPNNQSPEKMHLLRTLGAEVKAVPEKPYKDPENYNHIARRLAEERGWVWAKQFDKTANRAAHYRSTGPEIWKQTEGKVSAFVAAVGTGGTLAGVSGYLKEQNPKIAIVCADPYGAAMWSWFTNGNLETNDGDSIAEGIGQGRVTKNIEGLKVDRAYRIPDETGLTIVYQLLRAEALFLGLSSGINVAGAARLAKESGPGQTIFTVLFDSGHKYQSTLFNRDWLASNHLDPDLPLESVLARESLAQKPAPFFVLLGRRGCG